MNKIKILTILIAAPVIVMPIQAFSADAKLSLSAGSIGVGLGATRGEGVLTYKGHEIPVKYTGASLGDLGVTAIKMDGDVNNLKILESFNGCYKLNKIDSTIGVGSEDLKMKNEAGVELVLKSKTKGLSVSLSTGCAQMKLDPNAVAALKEPPVPANYQASVFFDTNSDKIGASENPALDDVIALLKKEPATEVIISGYADTRGSEKANLDLSERRASSVLAALKEQAEDSAVTILPPTRVQTLGRGEVKGGPQNQDDRHDRRVDIMVLLPARG